MVEVSFYHLQRQSLTEALPRLLERVLAAGHRVLLRTVDAAEADRLSVTLWVYGEASFLPHGTAKDGWEAEQPIFLTEQNVNPNRADILCQVSDAEHELLPTFRRVLDLFDGNDADAVERARERWRRYKVAGHTATYWQQKPQGGWEQKA